MNTIWQECPRGDVVGQWSALYVTLNKRGHITMSRLTYERAGAPRAFIIYLDKVNNRLGLKPTQPSIKNAYPVGRSGRHGGKLVRAFRAMQEMGIVVNETIRFHDVAFEDGLLILDLRSAKVSTRAKDQRKRAAAVHTCVAGTEL